MATAEIQENVGIESAIAAALSPVLDSVEGSISVGATIDPLPSPETTKQKAAVAMDGVATDIVSQALDKPAPHLDQPITPKVNQANKATGGLNMDTGKDLTKGTVATRGTIESTEMAKSATKVDTVAQQATENRSVSTTKNIVDPELLEFVTKPGSFKSMREDADNIQQQAHKIEAGASRTVEAMNRSTVINDNLSQVEAVLQSEQNRLDREKQSRERLFRDASAGGDFEVQYKVAGERLAISTQRYNDKLDEINAVADVDFTDKPLSWLNNYFFRNNGLNEELNVRKIAMDADRAQMDALAGFSSQAEKMAQEITMDTTDAQDALKTSQVLMIAQSKAALQQAQNEQTNAQAATAVMSASSTAISTEISILKAAEIKVTAGEATTRGTTTTQKQSDTESVAQKRSENKSVREQIIRDLQGDPDKETNDAFVRAVRLGRKKRGQTNISDNPDATPEALKIEYDEILAQKDIKGEPRESVIDDFLLGTRVVTPTPSQALKSFQVNQSAVLRDGTNRAINVHKNLFDTMLERHSADPVPLTQDNAATAFDNDVTIAFEAFHEVINESEGSTNPNRAIPMSELVKSPGLIESNNKFVAEVVTPYVTGADTKVRDLTSADLIELGVVAFNDKKVTFEQVVEGIQLIYERAIVHNNTKQARADWGIPLQSEYNVRLKGSIAGAIWQKQTEAADAVVSGVVAIIAPGAEIKTTKEDTIFDMTDSSDIRRAFIFQKSAGVSGGRVPDVTPREFDSFVDSLPKGGTK